jgi:hypothetical protein
MTARPSLRSRIVEAVATLLDVQRDVERVPYAVPAAPTEDPLAAAIRDLADDERKRAGHSELYEYPSVAADTPVITARGTAPLRIDSDGVGHSTKVYLGDHEIPGVLAVTWRLVGGDGVARALIEVEGIHLRHDRPAANGAKLATQATRAGQAPARPGVRARY